MASRLNQAVLWHLKFCEKFLDRLGYHIAAANVASAIDAMVNEAASPDEIDEMDVEGEAQARLLMEMFQMESPTQKKDDDESGE